MAGLISRETIDAVERTSDIVAIIGEYTKLERRGSNDYWGCCPFHNEKTPSFHVDADKGFYYCFGCHAAGSVVKFIQEKEKLSFTDTIVMLAKRAGIEVVYTGGSVPEKKDNTKELYIELYNRVAGTFHYLLTQDKRGRSALEYITSRGLTQETIEKFKLGYAPADRRWLRTFLKGKNFSDEFLNNSGLFSKKYPDSAFFSDRLMFPIFNRHSQVVAFGGRILHGDGPKYLNSSEMIQYKKGETLFAFNFAKKAIGETRKVIFCEGYMDCIAYHQCGIEYAVAPLGTALTEDQIKLISAFVDTVLLSFDSDSAGQQATLRAILMVRQAGLTCRVIQLKGGKDPAEIMLAYGAETLTNDVNSAILDSDYLLSKIGEEYPVDTPEGKTRAALAYFPYIDSLQSDIQKISCLEQLCQTFSLNPEAVRRDFNNREQAQERVRIRQPQPQENKIRKIKLTSELRAVLAVVTDLTQYSVIRNELTVDDFEDPLAKKIFIALEECYRNDADSLTINGVLSYCDDKELQQLIIQSVADKEFSINTVKIITDSIRLIKRNKLERKKENLMIQLHQLNPASPQNAEIVRALLSEKMDIDKKLQTL